MSTATERYTEAQQDLADAQEDARIVRVALVLGCIFTTLIPFAITACALLESAGMSALAGGAGGLIGLGVVGTGLCVMYLLWNVGDPTD